jgi:ribosomal protein S18 acetylase RimI-like enzyme
MIAERDGFVLRYATERDMPRIDEITIICYADIERSWEEMHGEEIYNAIYRHPEKTWQEEKTEQNHTLFKDHPECLWVLEHQDETVGYVSFSINEKRSIGTILNNGVIPEYKGKGLGRYMYRQVLQYLRDTAVRFAFVETGLDDPHIAARRAYEAVGFDRKAQIVLYWQDLRENNPSSFSE